MQRRELVKHGLAGMAGLGAGYTLVEQTTDNAAAAVSMSGLEIADASKTTKDGTISKVNADVSGDWSYNLSAGKSPHRWKVTLSVTDGETVDRVASAHDVAKYLRSSGSYELGGSITDTEVYNPSDFAAPEGKVRKVTMGLVVLFEVTSDSGETLAKAQLEDTATVKVTNEAYQATEYGSASGDGSLIIVD